MRVQTGKQEAGVTPRFGMRIGVLLVDDHPVVREGYRNLLEHTSDIRVIAEAVDCETALQQYAANTPDVVVLDLNMPGRSGLEGIRDLLRFDPKARILVFSGADNSVMMRRSFDAGALGYLLKSSDIAILAEAIRAVNQGRAFVDPSRLLEVMSSRTAGTDGPLAQLTTREFEVFRLLAEGENATKIAERLFISQKTVSVHQTNIMNKLGIENRAQLLRMAISCGVSSA